MINNLWVYKCYWEHFQNNLIITLKDITAYVIITIFCKQEMKNNMKNDMHIN